MGIGVRAACAAHNRGGAADLRENERERESTGMEQGAATAASAKFECGARAANKK
jgi:hypothetical protein